MHKDTSPAVQSDPRSPEASEDLDAHWQRVVGRRSFLKGVGVAGAAALPGSALFASQAVARSSRITDGDVSILRFLAAAEILESDLWSQYNELGGVNGGNPAYMAALQNLDGDMPQYIADNTDDELSHEAFINAYLRSKGARPVSLERFRTLEGSSATGAKLRKRLTNLKALNVDTSCTPATAPPTTPIWARSSRRRSRSRTSPPSPCRTPTRRRTRRSRRRRCRPAQAPRRCGCRRSRTPPASISR